MFDKYLPFVVGFGGFIAVSLAILAISTGAKLEALSAITDKREKSITGPQFSTLLCATFCLLLYSVSAYMSFSHDTFYFVIGIVGQIASLMFLITSVILSFAVINAIHSKYYKAV
jgi:hypothetical protein